MRRILIVLLLAVLLAGGALAEEPLIETSEMTQELPSEVQSALSDVSPTDTVNFWGKCREMLQSTLKHSGAAWREALRLCGVVLAVVLLCALAGQAQYNAAVCAVGALGLCAAATGSFRTMLTLAADTVQTVTDYNGCLLPVMASAAAMSGGLTAASALYTGTMVFAELLMQLISKFLVPGVWFYLAIAGAEAALGSDTLSELREFAGWLISKSLKVVLTVFTVYMSLTGVVSGSSDALAVKATQAAAGMVPVVGGILSDASESLLVSAKLLKHSAGVFGMLAVLAVCLAPLLRTGVQYLLLKLTAAAAGTVGLKPHVKLVKSFSTAMGYLLAMNGACALMSVISVVCFLRVAA